MATLRSLPYGSGHERRVRDGVAGLLLAIGVSGAEGAERSCAGERATVDLRTQQHGGSSAGGEITSGCELSNESGSDRNGQRSLPANRRALDAVIAVAVVARDPPELVAGAGSVTDVDAAALRG
jgi:hypothetical protein